MARQEELTKATEKLSQLQEELTSLKAIEKDLRAEYVALKEEVGFGPRFFQLFFFSFAFPPESTLPFLR